MKLSSLIKVDIKKASDLIYSNKIDYDKKMEYCAVNRALHYYLPKIEELEKENQSLKKQNKEWIKEFDKYDF